MKSLYDISWQVDEPQYREDPAYSYSLLAKYERGGFNSLATLYEKVSSPSLTFGSMVDTLLTDGQETFDARFMVADFPETPDSIVNIVKAIHTNYGSNYLSLNDVSDTILIDIAAQFNYQNNWKPETRAKVIREKGNAYYELLLISDTKEIVSAQSYQDAVDCVELLKTSESTKEYFKKDNPFDGIERLYQLKFKGEYEGIPVRCMMDLAFVDHKNKVIIPVDLKTSYKAEYDFYKSFVEWNYNIQATLYAEILRQNIEKDDYFKDFKIKDYRFIVVCNRTRNPLVWEFKDTFSIGDLNYGNLTLRNWRSIVKELDYYLKDTPRVPIGISETEPNDLRRWINDKMGN